MTVPDRYDVLTVRDVPESVRENGLASILRVANPEHTEVSFGYIDRKGYVRSLNRQNNYFARDYTVIEDGE